MPALSSGDHDWLVGAVSEARAVLDAAMSEREFQQNVLDLARLNGFMCYHTHDSRRSEPGFPDVVCVHPGSSDPPRKPKLLILELKSSGRSATDEQLAWLMAFSSFVASLHELFPHLWQRKQLREQIFVCVAWPADFDRVAEFITKEDRCD